MERMCSEIGRIEDQGEVKLRVMTENRDGVSFEIPVTTAEYLQERRVYNTQFTDPELQLDDNAMVLDKLGTPEEVCQELSKLSDSELEPFKI